MSYTYSKSERKIVYADPEGTIGKYRVRCTADREEYGIKRLGFIMLYLTKDKFIIRNFFDPDKMKIKGNSRVYIEIPFSSIKKISCCGEDFLQIIRLSDLDGADHNKTKFSIEFTNHNSVADKLDFIICYYISTSKNVKECQELVDLYNQTVLTKEEYDARKQPKFPLPEEMSFEKTKYADPEGTISKYRVRCTADREEYGIKSLEFIILYLTKDKFIISNLFDPDMMRIKGNNKVYIEIPFSSIITISCCNKDFSQIASLSDVWGFNVDKSVFSIEFTKNDGIADELEFRICCSILSFAKNVKECQKLIDLYNQTALTKEENIARLKMLPLLSEKMYLRCPTLNLNDIIWFKVYRDCFVLKPRLREGEGIRIPVSNVLSFTHEQNFDGFGRSLSADSCFKLVYQDDLNGQVTVFLEFYILSGKNAYPRRYIELLAKLSDMGIIDGNHAGT